ncbi:hypothetical protein Arub01_29080 [Actinomadura rubrobrunea]|uniref:Uncharacterized protein n=1 Tax=Actinomadura rubrobrunea TaxID=115335 RepID=A0A9W6PUC8_9ACTN|nr:hypothetical protein [Actinomadura rubrobrunea]GLW64664.1 hypothetical protein Arub01_29080 [Actinomadura rubrobrunea]
MNDRTGEFDHSGPLAALAMNLSARRLAVTTTPRGLRVVNKDVPGCCDDSRYASDTVSCRPRAEDGGTLWFFTSWGEPIAPADQVEDAAMYIHACLSRRPESSS